MSKGQSLNSIYFQLSNAIESNGHRFLAPFHGFDSRTMRTIYVFVTIK